MAFIDHKGRTPFRIAISCRVPVANLATMLQNGAIDPTGGCPLSTLVATATRPDVLWPGQPKPLPALTAATTELARATMVKIVDALAARRKVPGGGPHGADFGVSPQ